jgi:uncharacterized protein YqiB (DUF1249 family)
MGNSEYMEFSLQTEHHFVGKVLIQQLESCKYTDTFLLEQIASAGKWVNNPKLTVRLYHDAVVAEVVKSCGRQATHGVNPYPNKRMHHPDEKNQLNAFLAEWLNFCLMHGCCDVIPFTRDEL